MPNYDWRNFSEAPPQERYPEGVIGRDLWRDVVGSLRTENGVSAFDQALRLIVRARFTMARTRTEDRVHRPRVFISHRRKDVAAAERIAWLACHAGYEYWLDVHDPALAPFSGGGHLTLSQAKQVALIIEMALLNSTHVIAVMTPATLGSQWVPYEYGRVKEPTPHAMQAAAWLHPGVTQLPEYLHLGALLYSEPDIQKWLKDESTGFDVGVKCDWLSRRREPPSL